MGEFVQENLGRKTQCTKLVKLQFDSIVLDTKEKEQALEGREMLENKTEIVIRPIILNEVNLD